MHIFFWKDLQRHYKKSFKIIEEIDALDYEKFYSAEQDFFKVLDFFAAIASVPNANNTAKTANKEIRFLNVFFIIISSIYC